MASISNTVSRSAGLISLRLLVFLLLFAASAPAMQAQPFWWTQQPAYPTARSGYASTIANYKLYLIGGRDGATNYNTLHVANVPGLGGGYGPWVTMNPMANSRYFAAAAAGNNGRIYVFGGYLNGSNTPSNVVEEYNPATNTWATRAPMPVARARMQAVNLNGLIYVMGGVNNAGTGLSSMHIYNPATNTWSAGASMTAPRADFSATVIANLALTTYKIVATGGRPSLAAGPTATVETFDPGTMVWTAEPWSLPQAVYGHATAFGPITKYLFLAGGFTSAGTPANTLHYGQAMPWLSWQQPGSVTLDRPMYHFPLFASNNYNNYSEDLIVLGGLTTGALPVNNFETRWSVIALPTEELSLTAVADGPTVHLSWDQALDNAMDYHLDRSSDGQNFVPLQVSPCGLQDHCTAIDANPFSTGTYYRLRAVLDNGDMRVSQVVFVSPSSATLQALAYPSGPRQFSYRYSLPQGEASATLQLCSTDGRVLRTWDLGGSLGTETLTLDGLAAGICLLRLRTAHDAVTQRIRLD